MSFWNDIFLLPYFDLRNARRDQYIILRWSFITTLFWSTERYYGSGTASCEEQRVGPCPVYFQFSGTHLGFVIMVICNIIDWLSKHFGQKRRTLLEFMVLFHIVNYTYGFSTLYGGQLETEFVSRLLNYNFESFDHTPWRYRVFCGPRCNTSSRSHKGQKQLTW